MRAASALFALVALAGLPASASELSIATFNVWGAGTNGGDSHERTVAALEALDADIYALQEVRGESSQCSAERCPPAEDSAAAELAAALGYHLYEQAEMNDLLWANAILSRYPIVSTLPDDLGVQISVEGRAVEVFNVHLTDYPYQPYQLSNIEYGNAPMLQDGASAIRAAEAARGAAVDQLLGTIDRRPDPDLVVICGDFNEPSHLDWTDRAARSGLHPLAVRFPASVKLARAGFLDGYRAHRPDEVANPGFTWTPLADSDSEDEHHDRIDFVYLKARDLRVVDSAVAGEASTTSDIVVSPWPSDHRAVRIRLSF